MKYRTQLTDPLAEKPQQVFHPNEQIAAEYAIEALKKASPLAYCSLYVEVEVLVHIWKNERPKV